VYLTTADIARRCGLPLRTAKRRVAAWARAGWPRVERVARPAGGWQWQVLAEDFERAMGDDLPESA
jgi:hypothetical protein